jgi:hypothetical protein
MTVGGWIEMGATLGVQGLEFYSGFDEDNEAFLRETKASLRWFAIMGIHTIWG